MTQTLAIFDLDDTLTLQDTESLWQEYLARKGLLSPKTVSYQKSLFKKHYNEGSLDIQSVIDFSLTPIASLSFEEQLFYQQDFAGKVLPKYIPQASYDLISRHKNQGHKVLIISAGHEFVVHPAASSFDVDAVLCTQLQRKACGAFTSKILGAPLFQEQKIQALKDWLRTENLSFDTIYFYSDSINDLPLLEYVDLPVAVNPCDRLRPIALLRQWPIVDVKHQLGITAETVNPANSSA